MKNIQPAILVVEGVDCVGKTTLAKAIALKYGFQYLYTPQIPLATIRKEVEMLDDSNTRFFYYLTSVIAVQKIIQTMLSSGKSLIIDRYIHSTFVMHQMLGVDVTCVNIEKLPILWPTISILLTAQSETRSVRKSGRDGLQDYDERIEQSAGLLDRAQQAFLNAHQWSLILETDHLLAEQVEAKVTLFLQENGNV
jgi:thymidylate kinase